MLLSASYLNIARITRAFLPIFKVRFSHFGLMTFQIKIFSRHLSKYSGIIKISSFFDLIIQLFMFTYSARHARAFFSRLKLYQFA